MGDAFTHSWRTHAVAAWSIDAGLCLSRSCYLPVWTAIAGAYQVGVIQIRLIAGVCLLCSLISVALLLVQFISYGAPFDPAPFAPAVVWIALAFFLLKGSKVARLALAVLSIIGAAGSLLASALLALTPPGAASFSTLMYVSFGVIFAGIAYLLLFSNDLKEEVLRRAKIRQSRERLDRQKYYESLGTRYEDN